MARLILIAAAAVLLQLASAMSGCPKATYKVTIKGLFTAANVPGAPAGPHFSPLTVFSHSHRFSALALYGYASDGIKDVAETGSNAKLLEELSADSAMPFVKAVATSDGPFDGDDEVSVIVMVDCNMPVITAVSMVAPSPDWMIALANINMWQGRFFYEKMEGTLNVYDAGTDSGTDFTSPDMPTSPRENIAPLGAPFTMPVAEYKIERMRTGCRMVKYLLTVENMWTSTRFLGAPENMFSPLTAFTHSRRFSAFALLGRASPGVQKIAETGDNSVFLEELGAEDAAPFIRDISTSDGPAPMGTDFNVTVEVDCMSSYVSFISMMAPSPDWIVAQNSVNLMEEGRFIRRTSGRLYAYDAGTDSGMTPMAPDMPTSPKENIARLDIPPYNKRHVGFFTLKKMLELGEM